MGVLEKNQDGVRYTKMKQFRKSWRMSLTKAWNTTGVLVKLNALPSIQSGPGGC